MVRFLKWGIVTIGIFAGLIIGAAVLVPMFVDVGKYLPDIEAIVTRQTGRSFSRHEMGSHEMGSHLE